jgi:Lrp/AsnC family transcriptional regulator for asnA, asnC and gidA
VKKKITDPGKIDEIDRRLIKLLAEDGRRAVKELSIELNLSVPTVQSRMKRLIEQGVLKIAGLVNASKAGGTLIAIIGIRVEDVSKMARVLDQLAEFKQVSWATAVTGQYDIFAEVIITEGIESIFDFYVEEMSKLDGVTHSESYMITKTKRKWTLLPPDIEGWLQA